MVQDPVKMMTSMMGVVSLTGLLLICACIGGSQAQAQSSTTTHTTHSPTTTTTHTTHSPTAGTTTYSYDSTTYPGTPVYPYTPSTMANLFDGCDGVAQLENAPGQIRSPNYPDEYDNESECQYLIIVEEGLTVGAIFDDMSLEPQGNSPFCKYDYVRFYDGVDDSAKELKTVCGNDSMHHYEAYSPLAVQSTGRYMFIKFVTDHTGQFRGFQLQYHGVAPACGGELHGTSAWLSSPRSQWSGLYLASFSCGWHIALEDGLRTRLHFYDFDLEKCPFDFVEVSDGAQRNIGASETEVYCGDAGEGTVFESSGSDAFVHMETDESNEKKGFKALSRAFVANPNCGSEIAANDGAISFPSGELYQPNRHCEWVVTSDPDTRLVVTLAEINTVEGEGCASDFLEVRNGVGLDSPLLKKYCGDHSSLPAFRTDSNKMYVRFKTGPSEGDQGFQLLFEAEPGCGGVLRPPSGIIQSPNYPLGIQHPNNCSWTLDLPPHFTSVTVELLDVDIGFSGPNYDWYYGRQVCSEGAYAVLGDLNSQYYSRPLVVCGTDASSYKFRPVPTSSYLDFISTREISGRGFQLKYTADCHNNYMYNDYGNLSSPSFPQAYDYDMDCTWTVYGGTIVTLTIEHVNLPDCATQHLIIEDKRSSHTLCGSEQDVTEYIFFSSAISIKYKSPATSEEQGFQMSWASRSCSEYFDGNSGNFASVDYPNLSPGFLWCTWNFYQDGSNQLTVTLDTISWTDCDNSPLYFMDSRYKRTAVCHNQTVFTSVGHGYLVTGSGNYQEDISFSGTYDFSCGGDLMVDYGGYLQSPGFEWDETGTVQYDTPLACTWTLQASDPASYIHLNIYALKIGEVSYDCSLGTLTVQTEEETWDLCGQEVPRTLSRGITAHSITLTFSVLDGSVGSGFAAEYSPVSSLCGDILEAESGVIESPNYPNRYPGGYQTCRWFITAPRGRRVEMTFTSMNLALPNDTSYCWWNKDYVVVKSNWYYCLPSIEEPITVLSDENNLDVHFNIETMNYNNLTGFSATYQILDGCGGELQASSGSFSLPAPPSDYVGLCQWKVEGSPGMYMQLDIDADNRNCSRRFEVFTANRYSLQPSCEMSMPYSSIIRGTLFYVNYYVEDLEQDWFSATFHEVEKTALCGGVLSSASGTFEAPDIDCPGDGPLEWVLGSDSGVVHLQLDAIRWTFTSEDDAAGASNPVKRKKRQAADCDNSITVYDGEDSSSPVLHHQCFYEHYGWMPQVTSTSSKMFLSITTGGAMPYFQARYSSVCFYNVTDFGGPISSPDYPNDMGPAQDCVWYMATEYPSKVALTFHEVSLPDASEGECNNYYNGDRIELYEYFDIFASYRYETPIHVICNSSQEDQLYMSPYSSLFIRFVTGQSTDLVRNFVASAETVCSRSITTGSNYWIGPTGSRTSCTWEMSTYEVSLAPALKFPYLNAQDDCDHHWVDIRDGDEETRFCLSDLQNTEMQFRHQDIEVEYHREEGSHPNASFSFQYKSDSPRCGFDIDDESGELTSTDYPGYESNQRCTWTILAPSDYKIQLTFTDFDLEYSSVCSYDYVSVHDGPSQLSPSLSGLLCNTNSLPSPHVYQSTGDRMTVRFKSDGSVTGRGFSANFLTYDGEPPSPEPTPEPTTTPSPPTTVPSTTPSDDCDELYDEDNGYISSPRYPGQYGNNRRCHYVIEAPEGSAIQLIFTFFQLETHSYCSYDYVQVFEGEENDNALALSEKLCTNEIPEVYVYNSVSNMMLVYLKTDGSVTRRGFRASYSFHDGTPPPPPTTPRPSGTACGGVFSQSPGQIHSTNYPDSNYENSERCYFYIDAPEGSTIHLTFEDFDLEDHTRCNFDYVSIYDGGDDDAERLEKLCGSGLPSPVQYFSTGRRMLVLFRSDGSVTRDGFLASYEFISGGSTTTSSTTTFHSSSSTSSSSSMTP